MRLHFNHIQGKIYSDIFATNLNFMLQVWCFIDKQTISTHPNMLPKNDLEVM